MHKYIFNTTIVFRLFVPWAIYCKDKGKKFKDSTQAIYFGMAEKYHVVGRYGGHKWHSSWLKDLDA